MKTNLNKILLIIPDEALIYDLRKTAKSLGKRSLSAEDYSLGGTFSRVTICRRFGGWNNALRKAELEIGKHYYISIEELMRNMKQVWDSLKRQPVLSDMTRLSAYSGHTYIKKFSSWSGALEAFVKYRRGNSKYKIVNKNASCKVKRRQRINVTKSMRYDILKRDSFKCRLCGASPAITRGVTLHIDHIIPRSKNGVTTPGNLQTLCSDCNYGKGAK